MRYRKKPVEVEAVRFTGDSYQAHFIRAWMDGEPYVEPALRVNDTVPLIIETPEGTMRATAGDWIIKGVNGEFYPCKHEVFMKTYDPIDHEAWSAKDREG